MILTCPACATRYFVREGSIPPEGRKVRCAGCGHMWMGVAEADTLDLAMPGDDFASSFETPQENPFELEPPPPTLPTQIRAKVQAQRRTREAMAAGVVWAVMAAAFAMILVGAVLFRVEVVRIFPATAGAYAAVKLPVNPTGLSLEAVQGGPGLSNGRATLIISGVERNVETDPRPPAAVRVSLYDKSGRQVGVHSGLVEGPPLAPGETRTFSVNVFDPPINVAEFQVEFSADQHPPELRRRRAPAPVSGGKLRGEAAGAAPGAAKAPEPAKALPENSPYALPASAKAAESAG